MPNIPACCSRGILRPAVLPWSRWCKARRRIWCPASVRPQTYRFGRVTKKPFGKDSAPIDLAAAAGMLGDAAERLFGGPQDMEWAYRDGRFHLVQSRDITRSGCRRCRHVRDAERPCRALSIVAKGLSPIEVVFAQERAVARCCRGRRRCRCRSWKRCGRPAAVSILPRASSGSAIRSRTARPIS